MKAMTRREGRSGVPAPYALPAAFAALFAVGTVAAALNGRLPGTGVLIAAAIVVGVTALIAEPLTSVPLAAIGWLTVTGFSRPPYAELRPTGPAAADAAILIGVTALGAAAVGTLFRWLVTRFTLENVSERAEGGRGQAAAAPGRLDRGDHLRAPAVWRSPGAGRRPAADAAPGRRAGAPEPRRRPAAVPARRGDRHRGRRILAGRASPPWPPASCSTGTSPRRCTRSPSRNRGTCWPWCSSSRSRSRSRSRSAA